MNQNADSVLIVDDDFLTQELWTIAAEDMRLNVCGRAATAEQAIGLARAHSPSVVLMDMRLAGEQDGVDAALAIRESIGSKIIFITSSREPLEIRRIMSFRPTALLFKPVDHRRVQSTIMDAMQN